MNEIARVFRSRRYRVFERLRLGSMFYALYIQNREPSLFFRPLVCKDR
jgi:hypothetical protein